MTSKEKARDLVDKIQEGLWRDRAVRIYQEDAVYTALIAIDEILNLNFNVKCDASEKCVNSVMNYWEEVKSELENF